MTLFVQMSLMLEWMNAWMARIQTQKWYFRMRTQAIESSFVLKTTQKMTFRSQFALIFPWYGLVWVRLVVYALASETFTSALSDWCSHVCGITDTCDSRASVFNRRFGDFMVCLSWLISDWRRHSVSVYKKRYHLPYWACNHFHQLLSHRAFSTPSILFTRRFILGFVPHMQACTIRLWHRTLVNGNTGWLRPISVSPTHKRYVCPRWQQERLMQYCSYMYSCWKLNLLMACLALKRNTVHGLGTKSDWIKAFLCKQQQPESLYDWICWQIWAYLYKYIFTC